MVRKRREALVAGVVTLIVFAGASPARADAVRDGQWYLGALDITAAQGVTRGQGMTIGIVDTGVDGSIPDLAGAVVAGRDFTGEGGNGQQLVDDNPHGTNVASMLVGRGNGKGNGVIGVAPAAKLLTASVKISVDEGRRQLPAAIRWAVDNGAKVVSLSLGGYPTPQSNSAYRYAQAHDVVIVAGSGNSGEQQALGSCTVAGVVCVGGIDKNLERDPSANIDPRLTTVGPFATDTEEGPRSGLPVAEPATSTTRYRGVIGTSFATPVVAGIIALIRAKYPNMNAANVINRLIRTARPVGKSPNPTYGYGIPDAYRALTADVPTVTSNPLGTLVTPSPSASPTTTSPASSSPAALPRDDSGGNIGVIAGIVAAVVVALAAIAFGVTRRRGPTT